MTEIWRKDWLIRRSAKIAKIAECGGSFSVAISLGRSIEFDDRPQKSSLDQLFEVSRILHGSGNGPFKLARMPRELAAPVEGIKGMATTTASQENDSGITIDGYELLGCFQGKFQEFVYELAKDLAGERQAKEGFGSQSVLIETQDIENAGRQVIDALKVLGVKHPQEKEFAETIQMMERCFGSKCKR